MLNSATGIPLDATCRQIIQLLTFSAAQAALYIPSNWLTNGFLFKVIDAATTTCNRTHLIKYPPTVSDFLTYWSYMWSDHYQITDNLQLACAQASTSIATISLFRMALWGEIVQTGRLDWNSQDRPGQARTWTDEAERTEKGQTGKTWLTFKLRFPVHLCSRPAFAILIAIFVHVQAIMLFVLRLSSLTPKNNFP